MTVVRMTEVIAAAQEVQSIHRKDGLLHNQGHPLADCNVEMTA